MCTKSRNYYETLSGATGASSGTSGEGSMPSMVINALTGDDVTEAIDWKEVSNLSRDHVTMPSEIAFIDRNVDDLERLLGGLRPELDAILLSDDEPAPRQMA